MFWLTHNDVILNSDAYLMFIWEQEGSITLTDENGVRTSTDGHFYDLEKLLKVGWVGKVGELLINPALIKSFVLRKEDPYAYEVSSVVVTPRNGEAFVVHNQDVIEGLRSHFWDSLNREF